MFIPLANGNKIDLQNVVLASRYDSNLISLNQLRETGITFHNNPTAMTLMTHRKVIAQAKRDQNLFTLELAHHGRAMAVTIQPKVMAITRQAHEIAITGQEWPTHLVSQNKRIRLWYRRLVHASNAWVVRASKLFDGINLRLEKEYNLAEVFVDSEELDADDADNLGDYFHPMTGWVQPCVNPSLVVRQVKIGVDKGDILDKLYTPCVESK